MRSSRLSQQFSWRSYNLAILALYLIGPCSRPGNPDGLRVVCALLGSDRVRIPAGSLMAPENPKFNKIQFARIRFYGPILIGSYNRLKLQLFTKSLWTIIRKYDFSIIDFFGIEETKLDFFFWRKFQINILRFKY